MCQRIINNLDKTQNWKGITLLLIVLKLERSKLWTHRFQTHFCGRGVLNTACYHAGRAQDGTSVHLIKREHTLTHKLWTLCAFPPAGWSRCRPNLFLWFSVWLSTFKLQQLPKFSIQHWTQLIQILPPLSGLGPSQHTVHTTFLWSFLQILMPMLCQYFVMHCALFISTSRSWPSKLLLFVHYVYSLPSLTSLSDKKNLKFDVSSSLLSVVGIPAYSTTATRTNKPH